MMQFVHLTLSRISKYTTVVLRKAFLVLSSVIGPLSVRKEAKVVRIYELMFVVAPTLEENARNDVVDKVVDRLKTQKAEVLNVDRWGIRKLAYEVKKFSEGDYTVLLFKAEPSSISQFEDFLKLTPDIIRHQVLRREDLEKKPEEIPGTEESQEEVIAK